MIFKNKLISLALMFMLIQVKNNSTTKVKGLIHEELKETINLFFKSLSVNDPNMDYSTVKKLLIDQLLILKPMGGFILKSNFEKLFYGLFRNDNLSKNYLKDFEIFYDKNTSEDFHHKMLNFLEVKGHVEYKKFLVGFHEAAHALMLILLDKNNALKGIYGGGIRVNNKKEKNKTIYNPIQENQKNNEAQKQYISKGATKYDPKNLTNEEKIKVYLAGPVAEDLFNNRRAVNEIFIDDYNNNKEPYQPTHIYFINWNLNSEENFLDDIKKAKEAKKALAKEGKSKNIEFTDYDTVYEMLLPYKSFLNFIALKFFNAEKKALIKEFNQDGKEPIEIDKEPTLILEKKEIEQIFYTFYRPQSFKQKAVNFIKNHYGKILTGAALTALAIKNKEKVKDFSKATIKTIKEFFSGKKASVRA